MPSGPTRSAARLQSLVRPHLTVGGDKASQNHHRFREVKPTILPAHDLVKILDAVVPAASAQQELEFNA